jgi:PAS domain S-box-containing protein
VNLETLFELSLDMMAVAGFDGYFKHLNPVWSKTLGWTQEEFLSRPSIEFVHPEDQKVTLESRARLKDGEPLYGLVNRYVCKDGSFRWLQWNSVAHREQQLVYAVARDITRQLLTEKERDRYSKELVIFERLASIGRLSAGVAHEINNPLAVVISNLEYARRELAEIVQDDSREILTSMAEAFQSGMRIQEIVRNLRAFARTGEENRVRLSVSSVMQRTLQLVGNELRKRTEIVESYRQVPDVIADEASLGEVFRHLLFNAADFMSRPERTGNEIRVTTWTD